VTRGDAWWIVARYVGHYSSVPWHSAIGHVTPRAKLEGREPLIFAERGRKLEQARQRREAKHHAVGQAARDGQPINPPT
jgi:hypothetical protein